MSGKEELVRGGGGRGGRAGTRGEGSACQEESLGHLGTLQQEHIHMGLCSSDGNSGSSAAGRGEPFGGAGVGREDGETRAAGVGGERGGFGDIRHSGSAGQAGETGERSREGRQRRGRHECSLLGWPTKEGSSRQHV